MLVIHHGAVLSFFQKVLGRFGGSQDSTFSVRMACVLANLAPMLRSMQRSRKGAFQFRGETGKTPNHLRVTGAGTLSGEKYVYECDKERAFWVGQLLRGGAYLRRAGLRRVLF